MSLMEEVRDNKAGVQLSLFSPPRRRRVQPAKSTRRHTAETSQLAESRIAEKRPTIRAAVLQHIIEAGAQGAITEEIARAIGRKENTVSARVTELNHELHLIVDSGRRRPTSSGAAAVVWIAASASAGGQAG